MSRTDIIMQGLATLAVAPDGTVTIPKELVEDLGLQPGDWVTVGDLLGDHLALTPADREGAR